MCIPLDALLTAGLVGRAPFYLSIEIASQWTRVVLGLPRSQSSIYPIGLDRNSGQATSEPFVWEPIKRHLGHSGFPST